jgi:HEAT repeat protein
LTAGPSRIPGLFRLRPGEGKPVALAVGTSFVASGGLMIGQSAIEALFFARAGVDRLPVMYLILGGSMLAASLAIGALIARVGRARACIVIPLALAMVAAIGRLALATGVGWIEAALWLLQGIAQFVLFLAVWGLAGLITDTRQAKRFFPLIGAGGVLGLVLGGFATRPLAAWIGTPNLILVWVASLVAVAMIGARIGAFAGRTSRSAPDDGGANPIEELRQGLRYVVRSSLFRWFALTSVLFSLLFFSLYLPFSAAATARYPDPEALAGFFGVFFALSTGVAFMLSLFVTNRLLSRFGVPAVMLVLPVLYLVAFGVLMVEAGFVALAVFRFAQVAWLSGGAMSTSEAVINTVPVDRRDQTRAFLYGGPTQVGTVLAGLIALVGERALSPAALFGIGFACAGLTTFAMYRVRREYPKELVRALREGRPHVFEASPGARAPFGTTRVDPSAVAVARRGLGDPDPRVRRVAAHVLGDIEASEATAALVAALRDDDPDVRIEALGSIRRIGSADGGAAALDLLADADAGVRAAALDTLAAAEPADGSARGTNDEVRALLRDPSPSVRARAAAMVLRHGDDASASSELGQLARSLDPDVRVEALRAMRGLRGPVPVDAARVGLGDPEAAVRAEAALALARVDPNGAIEALVHTLADEHPVVRDAAAEALGEIGARAVGSVIASLSSPDRRRGALDALERLPLEGRDDDVRRFAAELVDRAVEDHRLGAAIEDRGDERLRLLKDSLLGRAEREAVDGLRAAALLWGRTAMTVALESVTVTDPAQRANALEVIESVGEREVVRPLIAMWETTPARADRRRLLAQLQHDPDEWIRACAELAARADEPTHGGGTMTTSLTTLPTMDRILFLRRVPLFAELAPPDLQPIASIAEEHTFADGDTIAEQGDEGDAMHIIVSGEVAVVVRDDGGERVAAVRSEGDVVGEMAVVTDRPRMAGLVANGDVRVLSIGRRQFEAIMRERPETAIGVIKVLCQRLAEPAP